VQTNSLTEYKARLRAHFVQTNFLTEHKQDTVPSCLYDIIRFKVANNIDRRESSLKLDRLLGILTILLQNDRITAPELAIKFEVNRRTIGRDIDTLCQAGIPIVTYQGVGGGISIAEGFKLDKTLLTADELSGIIAALKGIGSVSEKSQIERTLNKLHASSNAVVSLSEPIVIDLASYYKGQLTGKMEILKCAVLQRQLVEFDYYYEKGESRRQIEPYVIIFKWTSWYVFGFCLDRKDWRMFKLLRLWNLVMCEDNYIPKEIPPEKQGFDTLFTDEINLVALFDASEKYRLIESYGLDCYVETDDGLQFEFGFENRNYLISWLLGFGDKVKVIEPDDIAKEIQRVASNILTRYK